MARRATSDDATAVLTTLRRIVRYLRLADREAEAACEVSAAQLFVLHTLGEGPAASVAALAARTLTDPSSVSTVVARLVARGLVQRSPSRSDRRRAELRLTTAGAALVARAPRMPQAQMIVAIRAMPAARRAAMVRALDELAVAIGADRVAPRMLFEDEPTSRQRRRRAGDRS